MSLAMPVLWLTGPPGVGKTSVGWEIYARLIRSGVPSAYVDIDQLGICYPERPSDPGRHRLQAGNLAAVLTGHRAAGARCVVVSGVVDARHGVHAGDLPGAALTVCRLRADRAELVRRFTGRPGGGDGLGEVLREAAELDGRSGDGLCVDTTGLSVAEVAAEVRRRTGGWPGPATRLPWPDAPAGRVPDSGGHLLWVCGPTGVGKSAAGFQVYLRALRAGLTAGYLDVDQLSTVGPRPAGHHVRAHQLAAVWHGYRRAGARVAVVTGPLPGEAVRRVYAGALPGATLTVCRLHAGPDELTRRILARGRGGSWRQPGDPLLGRPAGELRRVAERAAREADALDRAGTGDRIDTDGRTVEQVADAIAARAGWLGAPRTGWVS